MPRMPKRELGASGVTSASHSSLQVLQTGRCLSQVPIQEITLSPATNLPPALSSFQVDVSFQAGASLLLGDTEQRLITEAISQFLLCWPCTSALPFLSTANKLYFGQLLDASDSRLLPSLGLPCILLVLRPNKHFTLLLPSYSTLLPL